MARDTGAKCRQCRREGLKLFLKGTRCDTPKCAVVKREGVPGMHQFDAFAGDGDRLDELTRFGLSLRLCRQGGIRAESGNEEKRDSRRQRHRRPHHGQPLRSS